MSPNSRSLLFHPGVPNMQVMWDASTLTDLLTCPEKYRLRHLEGWMTKEEKVDLEFGRLVGEGMETFFKEFVKTKDIELALRLAVREAVENSMGKLGSYLNVWRCTGVVKYKNKKGNAAKCPWSHKGKLYPAPGPAVCGECSAPTEHLNSWFPLNPTKDRAQVVRVLVWYVEEIKLGNLNIVQLTDPDGKTEPLVEWSWRIPFTIIGGVQYWLCGNLDTVKKIGPGDSGGEVFITDYKTTKKSLSKQYFAQFSPNVQVNLYDMVAKNILPLDIPYAGVAIEAIQVGQGWVRFGLQTFKQTPEQKAELFKELTLWLTTAQQFAKMDYWPRNRSKCFMCEFQPVCDAAPHMRPVILARDFVRALWNPLTRAVEEIRGLDKPPSAPHITETATETGGTNGQESGKGHTAGGENPSNASNDPLRRDDGDLGREAPHLQVVPGSPPRKGEGVGNAVAPITGVRSPSGSNVPEGSRGGQAPSQPSSPTPAGSKGRGAESDAVPASAKEAA